MKASKLLTELAKLTASSPASQYRWLVAFANWDGEPLSRDEWRDLKKELSVFFVRAGSSRTRARSRARANRLVVPLPTASRRMSQRDLTAAHQGVRRVLAQMARDDHDWHGSDFVAVGSVQLLAQRAIFGGRVAYLKGRFADVLPLTAFFLCMYGDVEPMRQCPACGRFFVRVRRQLNCRDATCKKKRDQVYFSSYAKTPKGLAARQRQYEAFCLKGT